MKRKGFMEGRQGSDLDPGAGRDTQVTEKGQASYLFIYAVHRQNSRGMLREAKGDGGVKTDRCDVITVEVALVWHFCQMFGSFLYKPDYCTRSHLHILLSAWITVKLFSNLQIRLPYQMTKFMIWSLNPNSDWKKKPLTENKYESVYIF